jgi:hypothetical protein
VLSFFEYLRQRTFQSVLAGMEDAMSIAEGKFPEGQKAAAEKFLTKFKSQAPPALPNPAASQPARETNIEQTAASVPVLPENLPPRRRGRPPRSQDSQE